ncbi:PREDICTED: MICOS complex subunit Mic10-like [Dufourea novaeangliae]|uniref:MICOS complex subunit Mic10-like n=1 Tax=Dufourea novaeangliae TaxID=178035 RepID=UPI000767CAB8|nr:PREDICTED: MICOS complex subunit Mic10-like [Dufourea novaeangliae]
MAGTTWTEDEIGRIWDRCLTDTLFKLGGGAFLGGVFCLFFYRRRKWPIIAGGGIGLGMGLSNCQQDLNSMIRPKTSRDCSKVSKDEAKKSS